MKTCVAVVSVIVVVSILIGVALGDGVRRIPADFLLGSATSAYQYEGAWDEDGKGPSLWDVSVHRRNSDFISNGNNADIAADGYHKYKEDIRLMKDMGLDFFRFSISWSRILPTGSAHNINRKGIEFYNNFIDELLRNNITPMVTTFQIDIPAKLQEYGAWTNPAMVDFYLDYVKVLFDNFGDRVKLWITINEPLVYCIYTYSSYSFPPFTDLSGIGDYMCVKNSLLAHARAYHLYNEHYKPKYNGQVGFAVYNNWYEPLTDSIDDKIAADEANEFLGGMFMNPIFSKSGDYPELVKQVVAAKSKQQGFPRSRLPALSESEVKMIKDTADFLGVNIYTTASVFRNASVDGMYAVPSVKDDVHVGFESDPITTEEFVSVPEGAHKLLVRIKEKYNNPTIYITENGFASKKGLNDYKRVKYINDYLNAVLDAKDDGCDIRGYAVWSFLDTFEWVGGYDSKRFGLHEVDFDSPNRTRTPRKSAFYYKNVLATRTLYKNMH